MTKPIGQRIAELRDERDWSQTQLGERSGLSQEYISQLESGKRPNPSMEVLLSLANAFDTTLDGLVLFTGKTTTEEAATPAA